MSVTELYPGTAQALRDSEAFNPNETLGKAKDSARFVSVAIVGRTVTGELWVSGSHGLDQTLALFAHGQAYLAGGRDGGLVEGDG